MVKISEPILQNALVYTNVILLLSLNIYSYTRLLNKFHDIIQQYGIMLLEKKMVIGEKELIFLACISHKDDTIPSPTLNNN